jgi:hypothetical protein
MHVIHYNRCNGEEYTWNKATSCIHNIFGGQRWVEHYGEVTVTNLTLGIHCKLTFVKVFARHNASFSYFTVMCSCQFVYIRPNKAVRFVNEWVIVSLG